MIRISKVSKTFQINGEPRTALDNISLDIHAGEVFGIIGRSGAGKSTLVRTLNLLERPSSGQIVVAGQDITALNAGELQRFRRRVGMVFQHFNLLQAKTVAENIRFPLKLGGTLSAAQMDARVEELLQLVGLAEQRHQFPAQLSGGQKQRVGIARALANQPDVLLCDEATSALDPETTQSILRLLLDINRRLQLTIVLITHEMDVIRAVCDRVAILERGQLVETGEVADVFLFPQHAVTRALLAESHQAGATDLQTLRAELGASTHGPLLRLSFLDEAATQPLLSQLSLELNLQLNVLQGTIGRIKGRPFGQLVVELLHTEQDLTLLPKLLNALRGRRIHFEVLDEMQPLLEAAA